MYNLLPDIQKTVSRKADNSHTVWKPADAHPVTGKVSFQLESTFTKEQASLKQTLFQSRLPQKEPNLKYADPSLAALADTKHLSVADRGVADTTQLALKPVIDNLNRPQTYRRKIPGAISSDLVVKVFNNLFESVDLFVQRKSSILTSTIPPGQACARLIAGELTKELYRDEDNLFLYFSTLRRSTVTTTSRQQLMEFQFNTFEPIGLEVEFVNERLVCTQVFPECQASEHALQLDGAEIVSVNGKRVIDLDEFRFAMTEAKQTGYVILQVAAFKGGRGKLDELYLHDTKKTEQVKSLFSNILKGGGGSITNFDSSSEEDDDDEEEVEDEGGSQGSRAVSAASVRDGPRKHKGGKSPCSSHSSVGSRAPSTCAHAHAKEDRSDSASATSAELGRGPVFGAGDRVTSDVWEHLEEYPDAPPIASAIVGQEPGSGPGLESAPTVPMMAIAEEGEGGGGEGAALRAAKTRRRPDDDAPAVIPGKVECTSINTEDDSQTVTSYDSSQSWNQLTKLETIYPFKSLVCVPPRLQKSDEWGNPDKLLRVSNFSTSWKVQLYWLDENGALVEKGDVSGGTTLMQPCSSNHVWAVAATLIKGAAPKQGDTSVDGFGSVDGGSVAQTVSTSLSRSPALLVLKPNAASLSTGKCTSILWTPWVSISVTQRINAQPKNSIAPFKSGKHIPMLDQEELCNLHFQVFDGSSAGKVMTTTTNMEGSLAGSSVSGIPNTIGDSLGKLEKMKLPKWPRKKSERRPKELNSYQS